MISFIGFVFCLNLKSVELVAVNFSLVLAEG